ncbi:MAG: sigma-54-dependent transcriptional regulator [Chloroflexota bacterium]
MAERLLIVEDESTLCQSLKRVLEREGYEVEARENAESALKLLEEEIYDLVVTDIILPGIDGIELLGTIKERFPEVTVIVITAYASLDTAIKAFRVGAYDYVVKPIIHEEIRQVVRNALAQKALLRQNIHLRQLIERQCDFGRIIGESSAVRDTIAYIKKIAPAKSNVLLLGETGTGKELVARAIHASSNRAQESFMPINCSAIPDNLLESELFGHTKGSFTGATAAKKGLFEEANRGTVFLDEIGDLSLMLQAKFLRVLEDQEMRPVGGVKSVKIDLRFITATNRDIEQEVKSGRFREDLYYRINTITIKLPPLRERREDIEPLIRYYLQKYSAELGKPVKDIEGKALDILLRYNWPGNVRELKNVIERGILISEDGMITADALPECLRAQGIEESVLPDDKLSIEDYSKSFVQRHQGKYTEQQLADMLGITRKALWEKRKRWGIVRTQEKEH